MQLAIRWMVMAGVAVLAGCAAPAPKPTPLSSADLWQDGAFAYQANRAADAVVETGATLFALRPDMVAAVQGRDRPGQSRQHRLQKILDLLYTDKGIRLAYNAGHSTGAQATWDAQTGDCLSLTILVYALAREVGIPAQMQEVRVPLAVDRRLGVDFISGHVNVLVNNPGWIRIDGREYGDSSLVIDFEPLVGSIRAGEALTEEQVLARFYNNRATEHLVQGELERAYAYYRAALLQDPYFAPAYANLAQLYSHRGLAGPAERLLRHSLALKGTGYAPLRELIALLESQGRGAEAQVFAQELAKRRREDPYHWLGNGLDALARGANSEAVDALEQAARLTTGFAEVHFNLALAYARNGQPQQAQRQLALLQGLGRDSPSVAVLQRKLAAAGALSLPPS